MQSTNADGPRIMLVDDDVDQLDLWELISKTEGVILSIRKGALSALEWLERVNYDIDAIVMDLSMPDMDGLTLTREIRNNENIRSKRNPILIFWFTGWQYDADNPHNPVTIAEKEFGIRKVWYKGTQDSDPVQILHEVRDIILSGAPDKVK